MTIANLETITDMQSWCRTWPPNGFSRIRRKQKLHKKRKRACKSSWSQIGTRKSFTLKMSLECGKAFEDLSWNHCTSTPHRSEQKRLLSEQYEEQKKEHQLYCNSQDWMRWSDSLECHCYLRNVQDLLADRKTPYERRFGESLKGPIILFGALIEYHPISTRDQLRMHQMWQESCTRNLSWICTDRGVIRKGDILISDIEELERMDASDIYPGQINAKEVLIRRKGDEFIFPFADGTAKLPGRDYEFREPTPRREQAVRRESQRRISRRAGRVSPDRTER